MNRPRHTVTSVRILSTFTSLKAFGRWPLTWCSLIWTLLRTHTSISIKYKSVLCLFVWPHLLLPLTAASSGLIKEEYIPDCIQMDLPPGMPLSDHQAAPDHYSPLLPPSEPHGPPPVTRYSNLAVSPKGQQIIIQRSLMNLSMFISCHVYFCFTLGLLKLYIKGRQSFFLSFLRR